MFIVVDKTRKQLLKSRTRKQTVEVKNKSDETEVKRFVTITSKEEDEFVKNPGKLLPKV